MKWGNHRANLYWEAHLKAGHVPPDQCVQYSRVSHTYLMRHQTIFSKMESFIRSKYESRRWALDGPPPADPSTLENGASIASPPANETTNGLVTPVSPPPRTTSAAKPLASPVNARPGVTTRQPQAHQLLSTAVSQSRATPVTRQAVVSQPSQVAVAAAPPPAPTAQDDLFSLDFHAPAPTTTSSTSQAPRKDVKNDILSLFSTSSASSNPSASGGFGQFTSAEQNAWGQPSQPQQQNAFGAFASAQKQSAPQPTSMMGNSGAGMWGTSSGWTAPAAQPPQPTNSLWGNPVPVPTQSQSSSLDLFGGSNPWGSNAPSGGAANGSAGAVGGVDLFGGFGGALQPAQKKDDAFGDLWGGFK